MLHEASRNSHLSAERQEKHDAYDVRGLDQLGVDDS